jgi:hypothetical protein
MVTKKATTKSDVPWHDLSQQVEDYYRALFDSDGRTDDFSRWIGAFRHLLCEANECGADAGFVLHCLVCTWDRRLWRHSDDIEAIQGLPPRKRAQLIGALRMLRTLDKDFLAEVLGPAEASRAEAFLVTAAQMETVLTGAVLRTPAWEVPSPRELKPGFELDLETACIVCLIDELKVYPKPAEAVAVIMEKAKFLGRSRGGSAGARVAKRAARAGKEANDRLSRLGIVIGLLRSSYISLREFLLANVPEVPDDADIWGKRARAWGTSTLRYRQAFDAFCGRYGIRAHVESLARFESELFAVKRQTGRKGVATHITTLSGGTSEADSIPARRAGT